MESVNKKIVLISVILAIFTSFLVYTYIRKMTAKPETVEYINVYVAAKTLPSKYKIIDSDIIQTKITRELLNSKAVLNKADIVGRRLKDSIIEGEQILKDRLVDDSKTSLAYSVPQGKRAVSINVNEQIDVSNLIRPGDYVDVVASFDKEEIEDASVKTIYPRITKIIIENVQLLALGQDQLVADEKISVLPKTITLAVNSQDVEKLVYASEYAVLRLSLRPVEDNKNLNTAGVIRSDVVPERGVKVLPK